MTRQYRKRLAARDLEAALLAMDDQAEEDEIEYQRVMQEVMEDMGDMLGVGDIIRGSSFIFQGVM